MWSLSAWIIVLLAEFDLGVHEATFDPKKATEFIAGSYKHQAKAASMDALVEATVIVLKDQWKYSVIGPESATVPATGEPVPGSKSDREIGKYFRTGNYRGHDEHLKQSNKLKAVEGGSVERLIAFEILLKPEPKGITICVSPSVYKRPEGKEWEADDKAGPGRTASMELAKAIEASARRKP